MGAALARLESDALAQSAALVRHWLYKNPPADWDALIEETAQALWLENRHLKHMANLLGARQQ